MENRLIFGVIIFALITACSPEIQLKGKFFDELSFNNERYFSHKNLNQTNSLKKITQNNGYGYYAWKTIAYNYVMENSKMLVPSSIEKADTQHVSIFKTILNSELLSLRANELSFVQKKGRVLVNNLYFLDDHRCIYISFDDDRGSTQNTFIYPLYFDGKNYKVKKKVKNLYEQYLRGYYTLTGEKGDSIFIHFHQPFSNTDYFIYGLIKEDAIIFTSMTIPNSPNDIYEGGYNAMDVNLKKIFNIINLPIFEWVEPVKHIFYPKQSYLSTGFELYKCNKKNSNEKNKLHERIWEKFPALRDKRNVVICGIEYTTIKEDDNERRVRKYTLKELGINKTYDVIEFIGLDEMSKCALETW